MTQSVPTNVLVCYTMVGQLLNNTGTQIFENVYWDVYNTPDMTGAQSGYVGLLQNIQIAATTQINAPAQVVIPTSLAGGDLSGSYPNPSVAAIAGNPLQTGTLGPADDGYILTWASDGYWTAEPPQSVAGFQAGGDLSGTLTNQTVIGIQAVAVSSTPPSTGQLLTATGAGAAHWAAAPSGFTAGGDLSGSSTNQTVSGIQTHPVQSGSLGSGQDGYVLTWVNTASTLEFKPLTYTNIAGTIETNGFRLTLATGNPVPTTDITSAGTIYLTPMFSGQIGLFINSAWTMITSPQVSLALSITSGNNYDVFAFSTSGSGVLSLELSSAWSSATARANALAQQDGVWVKSADHSRRYLGTIRATGTNITEDSQLNRFCYNFYNQQSRPLLVNDSTQNWTSPIGGWHQARGQSTNNFNYVCGMTWEKISVVVQACQSGINTSNNSVGVGIDSSTVNSAGLYGSGGQNNGALPTLAFYKGSPGLGYHQIVWLEWIGTAGEFYGQANNIANQIAGMAGEVNA